MKSSTKRGNDVEGRRSKRRLHKINNLPDEILLHILSFLPNTWYVVRTSILSRRWRYLFTFSDCLSFDDAPCFKHREAITRIETFDIRRFENFVYKVLELHQTSHIRKFSLVCLAKYDKSNLNAWVKYAIQKGVQEVHYQVKEYELPDELVTCKTLVKLKVEGTYGDIKIPLSSWLPNLKILHLNNIQFGGDYHSTERLLSSCKFLEELTLDHCAFYTSGSVTISFGQLKVLKINTCFVRNGSFKIEAPKLEYLINYRNIGVKIVPLWKHSCSLVKAQLHLYCEADDRNILRAAAYKTTSLHILSDSIQFLLTIGRMGQVHDFPCLSSIHFFYISYDSWKYVTSVIDNSPQLETVVFTAGLHRCYRRSSAPPPSGSLLPFSCHAKVIEVKNLCGHDRSSLLLLGHLLINARVLKKLIVRKCHGFDDMEEAQQISKDLLTLPRASSDCCIRVLNFNSVTTS